MKTCWIILAIACASLVTNASAAALEKTIQFNDLPGAVQSTAHGVIGSGKIMRTVLEFEETMLYAVQYEAGGKTFEVEISPKGKVLENAELIELSRAPEAIQKTIDEKAKGTPFLKIEKTIDGSGSTYVVEFTGADGNEDKLKIDSQGKVISEEHGD